VWREAVTEVWWTPFSMGRTREIGRTGSVVTATVGETLVAVAAYECYFDGRHERPSFQD